ncbi:hypothetical protein SELMODRAFT_117326 [Selaginella moellendorffii]|uniref:Pentacotripeptide-repeat region of PRORP domain-containing protein n=1 Tax=Selaginella moellendorffii TaxID=88036 RepID=D8SHT3_SELML|nr:hypothetical protein SELMODRAFT_117326 [Selaginella moellendorffii]
MPEKNPQAWNALLAAYARNGDVGRAKQVFDRHLAPNLISWNTIIAAYARSEEERFVDTAKRLFDSMPLRNIISWNSMLLAYSRGSKDLETVEQFFDLMPERSLVSFCHILSAVAARGESIQLKRLLDSMPERNLISLTTALSGFAHFRDLPGAISLFHSMPEVDLIATNVMLLAYAKSGHLLSCKDFFDSMRYKSIVSYTTVTLLAVLYACSHGGEISDARLRFQSISLDFGVKLSKYHHRSFADVLARSNNLCGARDLMESMPFVPDSSDWKNFLGACKSWNDFKEGAQASKLALEKKEVQDGGCYIFLAAIDPFKVS